MADQLNGAIGEEDPDWEVPAQPTNTSSLKAINPTAKKKKASATIHRKRRPLWGGLGYVRLNCVNLGN